MKIICPLEVKTSHVKKDVGFSGTTEVILNGSVSAESLAAFGHAKASLSLVTESDRRIRLEIDSSEDIEKPKQIDLVEKIAHYLSLLLARGEINQAYGTPFIEICWEQLTESVNTGSVQLSESVSIRLTRNFSVNSALLENISYSESLAYFYDGLRAEYHKSKFFHWFLILELLEHSNLYRRMFNAHSLFNEEEAQTIERLASSFSDSRKAIAVKDCLKRTRLPRRAKLHALLKSIGAIQYVNMLKEVTVSEEHIGSLLNARNRLFHTSSEFDETLLWNSLFPLVRVVIGRLVADPSALD